MKLQKQLSRKVNEKEYVKYVIVVSPSTIEKLGWTEGLSLKEIAEGDKLILKPQTRK